MGGPFDPAMHGGGFRSSRSAQSGPRQPVLCASLPAMCGRFASFLPAEALRRIFGTVNPRPNLAPSWNLVSTQPARVVRLHPETKQRHLNALIWGLVPYFTDDLKSARKLINARAETHGYYRGFANGMLWPLLHSRAGALPRVYPATDRQ